MGPENTLQHSEECGLRIMHGLFEKSKLTMEFIRCEIERIRQSLIQRAGFRKRLKGDSLDYVIEVWTPIMWSFTQYFGKNKESDYSYIT